MFHRLRNWFGFRSQTRQQLDRIERTLSDILKFQTGKMTPEELQTVVDRMNRAAFALEAASK